MKEGRFYWLKLKRDFFRRHDIRIIEAMPNGKDYILFYLKLLCESVDHEGALRFSDEIPYNEEMLATITETNIDVVRAAVSVFTNLGMMEVLTDGTIYLREVTKMIGSETHWAEKKRAQRAKGADNVPLLSGQRPTEIEIEKEIDIDIDKKESKARKRFAPPSVDDVREYCLERGNKVDPEAFVDFYASKGWRVGNQSMKDWKAAVRTWERREPKRAPEKPKGTFFAFPQREYDDAEEADLERKLLQRSRERGRG